LKFDSKRVGTKARLKAKPYMTCKRDVLRSDWTPIRQQSVRIGLGQGKLIKCRRIQFPITSACAITIHKPQDGTFEQIVLQYKRQDQRLVYVGMSRVTSLDGLYMTNATNDFTFYHGSGSVARGVREVRDEYVCLERHELPTLEKKVIRFMPNRRDREDKQETTLFISEMVWKQPHCTERNLRRRIRRSIKCPKEAAKEDTEDKFITNIFD